MPEGMSQNPERLGVEEAIEVKAEIQGNCLNIIRNLAKKANFAILKVGERNNHQLSAKSCLRAARFQKLTTRALSKEIRKWKQKTFQKAMLSP